MCSGLASKTLNTFAAESPNAVVPGLWLGWLLVDRFIAWILIDSDGCRATKRVTPRRQSHAPGAGM